jgi:hypothetical protein
VDSLFSHISRLGWWIFTWVDVHVGGSAAMVDICRSWMLCEDILSLLSVNENQVREQLISILLDSTQLGICGKRVYYPHASVARLQKRLGSAIRKSSAHIVN